MNKAERNKKAQEFIKAKLDLAEQNDEQHFKSLPDYVDVDKILKALICIPQKGFRGIVATAITGKFLNPSFDPLNDFYSCNPRSIFEKGIYYAFENRVSCGQSDPLNVAKNTSVLDKEWAKGKRPQSGANAVVDFLQRLETATDIERDLLIDFYFYRLIEYSNSIRFIPISVPSETDLAPQLIACKLIKFTLKYPESGTVPQVVISKLLHFLYYDSPITVMGGDGSVFGTNTTSKKPADIWLEDNNSPFKLFEVTVKQIDNKRLDDCLMALSSLNMLDKEVIFICRLPQDINSLDNYGDNVVNHKGKSFNFVDISDFIQISVSLLNYAQLKTLLIEMQDFVESIERPKKSKDGWNSIF